MKSAEIRQKFLIFFERRGHRVVASDLLVPQDDPSVLFTSAGMNQFKDQFMGKVGEYRRAATAQKCLRTADLVNVGTSPSHHTFFEMLGNFSFGDYFKEEAIAWAWEFVTRELGLPAQRLWVSVHKADEEAYGLWRTKVGVSEEKIVRLGDADNFWPANAPQEGPNGPCGPCSELFYDWGPEYGCGKAECSPACACRRFTEIWNLVFTQYDRKPDGSLGALPNKNIDTGMGLERITSVVQGVRSNYETDLFVPLIDSLREQLARWGLTPPEAWFASQARTVSDHMRAVVFAIADGVVPSNEERGYVVRKLLRRSLIILKRVGVPQPVCYRLVYPIAQVMAGPYPDVIRRHETIAGIVQKDEEHFWSVLTERAPQVEAVFSALAKDLAGLETSDPRRREAPAKTAFVNYDTYGIPLEMSREIAGQYGVEIDEAAFESFMAAQRERSRSATQMASAIFARSTAQMLTGLAQTVFLGYERLAASGRLIAIIQNGERGESAAAGETADLVLDQTPFYAESGGQAGDQGRLLVGGRIFAEVRDTKKCDEFILHTVTVTQPLRVGATLTAEVDQEKRAATARNHTATHLLQYALRRVLGEQVEQAGSFVSWEKLRFDFTHLQPLSAASLREIEQIVNAAVWANYPVNAQVMDFETARRSGALAFFQEKYGSRVRVLSVGGLSQELCGGTHVQATGEIGLCTIVAESSVAQGIRRIEALTGEKALAWFTDAERQVRRLEALLKVTRSQVAAAVEKLLGQERQLERQLQQQRLSSVAGRAKELAAQAPRIRDIAVVVADLGEMPVEALRSFCDAVKAAQDPAICIVAAKAPKPCVMAAVSAALVGQHIDAVGVIRELTKKYGGSGGGRPELAQAGLKDMAALQYIMQEALSIVTAYLRERGAA